MSHFLALTSFSLSVATSKYISHSAPGNKSLEEVAFPNLLYTVIWNLLWLNKCGIASERYVRQEEINNTAHTKETNRDQQALCGSMLAS